jgi:predicted nucleic acid-binding protein
LPALRQSLEAGVVLVHPFVIGELACGHLKRRAEILELLGALPESEVATQEEALSFVDTHELMGLGVGWIDVHLLASTVLSGARLWSTDKPTVRAAAALGILRP